MERKYTLRSDNPKIDGTTCTITGKCLAEIKCKADRILSHPAWREMIPASKKGVLA